MTYAQFWGNPLYLMVKPPAAISWQVCDFRLIESVTGQGRPIEHGRWPLGTAPPPPRSPAEPRCRTGAASPR